MAARYLAVSGGSNSNPGSETQPWATMAYAVTQLAAGDTLYCRGGTHGEVNITSTVAAGTSWDTAITVRSYPGELATLPRIRLVHTSISYWIFTDLLVDSAMVQSTGVQFHTGVDFVRISACEIRNHSSSAVVIDSQSNGQCEVIGNYIHDVDGTGVLIRASNNLIEANTIRDVRNHGISVTLTASTTINQNHILRNYVYSIGDAANDIGINVATGANNQVINNVVAVGTGAGIELGLDGLNTTVVHNTIYGNSGTAVNILSTNDGGNTVRNNILNNNGTNSIVDARGDVVASHNLTAAALFVNAAAGDFDLTSGSPAINAGINLGFVTVDFLGRARPQGPAPEMGAFEYPEVWEPGASATRQRGNIYARRLVGRRSIH